VSLRRIYPEQGPTTPDEATSGLRLAERAPADRPYLILNMITSADGAATVAGRTKELGSEEDRAIFHGLRTQSDAVMVGANTAAIEGYGRLVRDPERRERRRSEGLEPDPVACLVSGHLSLPQDNPLLQDPDSHVIVMTRLDGDLGPTRARVEYMREPPGGRELAPFMRRLRSEHGVRSVLCEGGPKLNATLLEEGLVDELFLSVAPVLVGGTPPITIVSGPPLPAPAALELVSALEAGGHLFLRYEVRG
jgi:5-amino-6-(5-phosphoribosylamino)uracil reductase